MGCVRIFYGFDATKTFFYIETKQSSHLGPSRRSSWTDLPYSELGTSIAQRDFWLRNLRLFRTSRCKDSRSFHYDRLGLDHTRYDRSIRLDCNSWAGFHCSLVGKNKRDGRPVFLGRARSIRKDFLSILVLCWEENFNYESSKSLN